MGGVEVGAELRVDDDAVLVVVDGTSTRVPYRRGSDGRCELRVDGRWVRAWSDGRATWVDGHSLVVVPAPRRAEPEAAGSLAAPMPATVLAVHVAAGDAVAAGQPCVVLSAMKTEIVLRAPRDGVVARVAVAAGQSVRAGEATVVLAEPGGA